MKTQYRATLTINVFIEADSYEEAQEKLKTLDYNFQDCISNTSYDSDLIDVDLDEVESD